MFLAESALLRHGTCGGEAMTMQPIHGLFEAIARAVLLRTPLPALRRSV